MASIFSLSKRLHCVESEGNMRRGCKEGSTDLKDLENNERKQERKPIKPKLKRTIKQL